MGDYTRGDVGDWDERDPFFPRRQREDGVCKSMWNIPLPAATLMFALVVTVCILLGVVIVRPPMTPQLDTKPADCQALLIVIRHAEKPKDAKEPGGSPDLSPIGDERAEYLGRCFSHTSPALPWGPPNVLMSVSNQSNGSRRSYDTLIPTSKALKKKIIKIQDDDYQGLIEGIDEHVECGETVVVAWHHSTMMELVEAIMPTNFWMYKKWPKECDPAGWSEPDWLPGSKCYDIMLSMPLVEKPKEEKKKGEKRWWPGWMDVYHEGFGGSKKSECAEDLTELDEVPARSASDPASASDRALPTVQVEDAKMELKSATVFAMNEIHEAMNQAINRVEQAKALHPQQDAVDVKVDVVLQ